MIELLMLAATVFGSVVASITVAMLTVPKGGLYAPGWKIWISLVASLGAGLAVLSGGLYLTALTQSL